MAEQSISQEFRLKNIEEIKNLFNKEIYQNEFLSKKHKKVSKIVNYIAHFLILASAVTGCISIYDFASMLGISIEIKSSAIELKSCAVTAAIKKIQVNN